MCSRIVGERYLGVEGRGVHVLDWSLAKLGIETVTHWQLGVEAEVHAMPEMMLAEASRLMMRRLVHAAVKLKTRAA